MIGEPLDVDGIVDILKREYESARDYCEGELREEQDAALRYFEAESFGNEIEGRSKVVLPDVQEACDYMKISMLGPFVAGDMVVEFEAEQEEDEAGAEEATHAIQYSFMRQQDGYRVLHDWIDSGLKEKIGAVKTTCITENRVTRETVVVDPAQMAAIEAMGEDAEALLGGAEVENVNENEDGSFNVVIKRHVKRKRFIDIPIPSEELRFKRRTKHEDDTDYIAHVVPMTRSELVDMGYDAEQVYDLTIDAEDDHSERDDTRGSDYSWRDEESSEALQVLLYCEEYARIDVDGDGVAERVKVCRVGDEILRYADGGELAVETIDEQPIVVFTPYPRAHRMVGISLAEKVMDLQLLRSTTARQLMDGMYNSNMPRFWLPEASIGDNTIDDLLNPIPGSPVRGGNGPMPQDMTGSFDVGKSLSVMEMWTGERETRTGITRLNQGLDDESLNKTATGMMSMQAKGEQHEEFLARNFAECLARLFAKKYRLMKREGEKFRLKVDGQYREADPTMWPEEMNLQIRVGLGTNSKQKRIQARMMLAPILAEGKAEGMVDDKHLFNAVDGLVRDLGLGKGDDFWTDPDAPPKTDEQGNPIEKPEKPDPAAMEAQAKLQEMQAKLQMDQAKAQGQMQIDQMKAQASIQAERERNAMQMEVAREKAELEATLARDRAEFEATLATERASFEQMMALKAQEVDLRNNRPGGDLDK